VETPLDPSNARKALARIVEKTELRQRHPRLSTSIGGESRSLKSA